MISHYKILDKLGESGMGEVYKARDTRLDRDVAMKFLPSGTGGTQAGPAQLLREAGSASSLNHPNVARVYDIGESESGWFFAMEYIGGSSLRELIRSGPVDIQETLRIGVQIASALAAAHAAGIVHQDVKPENILLTKDPIVKIVDFGLSTCCTAQRDETGRLAGTAQYMSPEQVRGEAVTGAADVWAAGGDHCKALEAAGTESGVPDSGHAA